MRIVHDQRPTFSSDIDDDEAPKRNASSAVLALTAISKLFVSDSNAKINLFFISLCKLQATFPRLQAHQYLTGDAAFTGTNLLTTPSRRTHQRNFHVSAKREDAEPIGRSSAFPNHSPFIFNSLCLTTSQLSVLAQTIQ